MPPVMITWVTPTAMMPITDDLQDHHRQALRVDQEALADEDPAEQLEDQRDADQHQEDADFRRQRRFAASSAPVGAAAWSPVPSPWPCSRLPLCLAARRLVRREFHDLDLVRFGAVEEAGDAALVHHQDAVAHAQHLRHLRRDHDDRDALAGQLA